SGLATGSIVSSSFLSCARKRFHRLRPSASWRAKPATATRNRGRDRSALAAPALRRPRGNPLRGKLVRHDRLFRIVRLAEGARDDESLGLLVVVEVIRLIGQPRS